MLHFTDPQVDGWLYAAGDDWFKYECSSNDIMEVDAVDDLIWSYYGESNFTVSRIIYRHYPLYNYWWDSVYIDHFCVPPNHYHWRSETGAQQCKNESTLNMYSPSTSFYMEYNLSNETNDWNQERVAAIVSPAKLLKVIITAHSITIPYDDDAHAVVLKLQWGRYVHQCTIALTTISNTYHCDRESTLLEHTNCSESAFVVKFEHTNSAEIHIDFISVIDEDNRTYLIDDSICFSESSIVVDFSTVWSDDNVSIYQIDNDAMCLIETGIVHAFILLRCYLLTFD